MKKKFLIWNKRTNNYVNGNNSRDIKSTISKLNSIALKLNKLNFTAE